MPTDVQGWVGGPSTPSADASPARFRMGRMNDLIVSEFRGKYGEAKSRGQLFHYCTLVAGQTIPLFSSTVQTVGFRNPPGSGVVLEFVRLELGYLSTNQVPGNLIWCQAAPNAGFTATGSGTLITSQANGQSGQLAGASQQPKSKCLILTGITVTNAPTLVRTLGMSATTMIATNAVQGITWTGYTFDGTDLLYPGADIILGGTVAGVIGVDVINLVGLEIPLPPGG